MQFPIDSSSLTFLISSQPRAVTKFGSDEIRMKDGQPIYSVELLVLGEDGGDKLNVKVPGRIDFPPRTEVRLIGLTATPWENSGRGGVSFNAKAIEVATAKLNKAS